jgi:hypothetical protein
MCKIDFHQEAHLTSNVYAIFLFVSQTAIVILNILIYPSGLNFLHDEKLYGIILFFSLLEIFSAVLGPSCGPPRDQVESKCLIINVWIFCPIFGVIKWLTAWNLLLLSNLDPFTVVTFLLNLPLSVIMLVEVIISIIKRK